MSWQENAVNSDRNVAIRIVYECTPHLRIEIAILTLVYKTEHATFAADSMLIDVAAITYWRK